VYHAGSHDERQKKYEKEEDHGHERAFVVGHDYGAVSGRLDVPGFGEHLSRERRGTKAGARALLNSKTILAINHRFANYTNS
jgi:hypothetical protein